MKIVLYVNFIDIYVIVVGNEVFIGYLNVLLFFVLVMNNIYFVLVVSNF